MTHYHAHVSRRYIDAYPQFADSYVSATYYVVTCPGWPTVRAADWDDAMIAADLMERMTGRFPDGFPSMIANYVQEEAS